MATAVKNETVNNTTSTTMTITMGPHPDVSVVGTKVGVSVWINSVGDCEVADVAENVEEEVVL